MARMRRHEYRARYVSGMSRRQQRAVGRAAVGALFILAEQAQRKEAAKRAAMAPDERAAYIERYEAKARLGMRVFVGILATIGDLIMIGVCWLLLVGGPEVTQEPNSLYPPEPTNWPLFWVASLICTALFYGLWRWLCGLNGA